MITVLDAFGCIESHARPWDSIEGLRIHSESAVHSPWFFAPTVRTFIVKIGRLAQTGHSFRVPFALHRKAVIYVATILQLIE